MGYFQTWNEKIEDNRDEQAYQAFVERYYLMEQEAYRRILSDHRQAWQGTAAELQEKLGFEGDYVIFAGFLDGIQSSLKETVDFSDFDEETEIHLDIDFEKLLYNMHEAGAKWLFDLEAWDQVLPRAKRQEIAKQFRRDHIAQRDEQRVGRNEPCPCGSGKKYKNCCGKAGQASPKNEN